MQASNNEQYLLAH